MDIFGTKIAGLQTKVEELEGAVTKLTTERDTAITEAATFQGKLTAAENAKASAEKALSDANSTHAAAITALKAEHAQKIEDEVITRIASAGIPPVQRDPSASAETGDNTMTREAFVKLSPAAQSQFCLKGGRIQG